MDQLIAPYVQNIKNHFRASAILKMERMQTLWSGYGGIYHIHFESSNVDSVVVKCISLEGNKDHPRGWSTSTSHQRKLKSYNIEEFWYEHYAHQLPDDVKVPACLYVERNEEHLLFALEDLSVPYPNLKDHCNLNDAKVVITWLAKFHAVHLGHSGDGLWEQGSYWHLDTRPDEWKAMEGGWLKENAKALDQLLKKAQFQTIIHGDAKLANFRFSEDFRHVAGVDFQYVGKGIGPVDLIYFLGSCLTEEECALYEDILVDHYFSQLLLEVELSESDKMKLEKEWRLLLPVAWADFNRFLLGWLPTHHKLNRHALLKNDVAKSILNK